MRWIALMLVVPLLSGCSSGDDEEPIFIPVMLMNGVEILDGDCGNGFNASHAECHVVEVIFATDDALRLDGEWLAYDEHGRLIRYGVADTSVTIAGGFTVVQVSFTRSEGSTRIASIAFEGEVRYAAHEDDWIAFTDWLVLLQWDPELFVIHAVPFEVFSARVDDGRCFDGATAFGEECHVLRVAMGPSDVDISFQPNGWQAVDVDGALRDWGRPSIDGIVADREVIFDVAFTLDVGSAPLESLRYYEWFTLASEAPIPAYA